MISATSLTVLLLNGLLLSACSRPVAERQRASATLAQQVTIMSSVTTTEFRFEPDHLSVRAHAPVRLTFDNRLRPANSGGALAHDFTIDNIRGRGLLTRLAGYRVHLSVAADSQATGEFELPAGTYEFYCSVDRHALDGMSGTLTIRE
jgi:plastocyanin